jgi:2-methylisocitrate lyase-like PEP mutase family enzyme
MLNTMCAPAEELAALGVRIVLQGHAVYYATLRTIAEAYAALREGAAPSLRDRVPAPEVQATALAEAEYRQLMREFLGVE